MAGSKLLELVSVLGVGIIGFGMGAFFANYIRQYAFLVVLIGIVMHGLAMYKIHVQNKKESPRIKFLYRLCWLILVGLAAYVLANQRG